MKPIISALLFSFLLIGLTSCDSPEVKETKHFTTVSAKSGSLLNSEKILSRVEGKNTAPLGFKVGGRIQTLVVEEGQKVKKGQILATLGNEESQTSVGGFSNILSTFSDIHESLKNIYKTRIESMNLEIVRAQVLLESGEKEALLAEETYANSLAILSGSVITNTQQATIAQKNRDAAEKSLQSSKELFEVQRKSLQKNARNSLSNAYIVARNIRDFSDELLGISEKNKTNNDGFERLLGAKNTQTKLDAETSFRKVNTQYETLETWYYKNIEGKENISDEILKQALNDSLLALESLRGHMYVMATLLENSISGAELTESNLQTLKTRVTSLLSNSEMVLLDAYGNGIKGSLAAIAELDASWKVKIQQAEDVLINAEESLQLALSGKEISVEESKKNLSTLKTSLLLKKDGVRIAQVAKKSLEKQRDLLQDEMKSKLKELEGKTKEVQLNKNLAGVGIESGILKAPFDGIILEKKAEVGMVVGGGNPILILSSHDKKIVRVTYQGDRFVGEKGKQVIIKSMKDEGSYSGIITLVNPNPDNLRNTVMFEAEVIKFPGNLGERVQVLFGEKGEQEKEGIIIPLNTIITKYGEPGVFLYKEGRAYFKLITLLSSSGDEALVDGIENGDILIQMGKEKISDGEELEENIP